MCERAWMASLRLCNVEARGMVIVECIGNEDGAVPWAGGGSWRGPGFARRHSLPRP